MAERTDRAQDADRLSALHELSIAVNSSSSLEELTGTAIRQLIRVLAPDVIFFYKRNRDALRLIDSWQVSVGKSTISPEIKKVGVCLCGLAASERKPVYSRAIKDDPTCTLMECKQAGITSFASLPLHGAAEIIGVLSFGSFRERDFSLEGHFLEIISSHIAVALQNTLFREELTQKVRELDSSLAAHCDTEKALMQSERRFREMLENANLIAIQLDTEGKITFANKFLLDLTGWTLDEIMRKDWAETFVTAETREAIRELHRKNVSGSIVVYYDNEIVTRGGEKRFISWTNSQLLDAQGKVVGVTSLGVDFTERKRAEDEKKLLQEQLLQAQKMEAVGQLAGGVAHDFNNILSAIIGYAHIIQRKTEDNSLLQTYVDHILGSSNRAAQLVQSLLAFSRKQPLYMKSFDLNKIIIRMERLLRRLIGEDITLVVKTAEAELTVFADEGQIEQVIMNLATNARDAMPEGGQLIVTSGSTVFNSEQAGEAGLEKPGRYAFVGFSDSGIGMTREIQEKIFEPFFTTKGVGKGTGLGLAMVYGIIKQHNGHVRVQSEFGAGTTFTVFLPLVKSAARNKIDGGTIYPRGGTETILLAEDDETLRRLDEIILSGHGYKVIAASDGNDAINKFLENREQISLCILDVVMPKKSGKEVYSLIKKTNPDMKVIFITGYSADIIDERVLPEGAVILLKPVDPKVLLLNVNELLGKYH